MAEELESITPVFTDDTGDAWDLSLDVGIIEDSKEKCSVDLDAMLRKPEELATLLVETPRKLVELLWIICETQATARNITPRDFGRRFKRDVIDRAVNSLMSAIVLFYPRGSAGRTLAEQLPAIIQKMDARIADQVRKNTATLLSDMRTDSRASST